MNSEKRKDNTIPTIWLLTLPLIGLIQKLLETFGWLERGSWLNFILLLIAPVIWVIVARRLTDHPFAPLVMVGGIYGILTAIIELIYWLNNSPSLGLGDSNWSFNDLMTAINNILIPGFRFLGNVMLGLFIGAMAGIAARIINNRNQT